MNRITLVSGIGALVSLGLVAPGCSASDNVGGDAGAPASSGSGGASTSAGGASAGTGGANSGGTAASSGQSGGSAAAGASGGLGASGGAGKGGMGGASGGIGGGSAGKKATIIPKEAYPQCEKGIMFGTPCASGSPTCFNGCGHTGSKAMECYNGLRRDEGCVYAEGDDKSCYKLPDPIPPCADQLRAGSPCSAPTCKPCGNPLGPAGGFINLQGGAQPGFCLCGDTGTWTCFHNDQYPCYTGFTHGELPDGCE